MCDGQWCEATTPIYSRHAGGCPHGRECFAVLKSCSWSSYDYFRQLLLMRIDRYWTDVSSARDVQSGLGRQVVDVEAVHLLFLIFI